MVVCFVLPHPTTRYFELLYDLYTKRQLCVHVCIFIPSVCTTLLLLCNLDRRSGDPEKVNGRRALGTSTPGGLTEERHPGCLSIVIFLC